MREVKAICPKEIHIEEGTPIEIMIESSYISKDIYTVCVYKDITIGICELSAKELRNNCIGRLIKCDVIEGFDITRLIIGLEDDCIV